MKNPKGWERFYAVVRRVPRGRVATYGQIAALSGFPRHARQVGYALNALKDGSRVPWHRVINSSGRISPRADPGWGNLQLRMLEAEGIEFGPGDRVSLERYGWQGSFVSTPQRGDGMGKGDRKSRKGKIWRGSFGNRRLRKKKKKRAAAAAR
jgi:methylated-DNA-protein-cysteine methyltransferase-like protein